jgi:hypothetical protein
MANLPPAMLCSKATRIVAARPSDYWEQGSSAISARLGVPIAQVRCSLITLVKEWIPTLGEPHNNRSRPSAMLSVA